MGTYRPHLTYDDLPVREGITTHLWRVLDPQGGVLGEIKWYGREKAYAFYPATGSRLMPEYFQPLEEKLVLETAKHRKASILRTQRLNR